MADAIEFRITGLDELRGKLQELSDDVRKKGGMSSLRKAAKVISNQARMNAHAFDDPETGRSIAANITERWNGRLNKRSGGDDIAFRIGVAGGAKVPAKGSKDDGKGSPTPHWRFVEFGTEKMQARPFLRPAIDQAGQQAVDTFVTEYSRAMDRALKRARKKRSS